MNIILLVGASGSGKTTIGKRLEELGIVPLVSFTTREKRKGEIEGEDYYFITEQEAVGSEVAEFTTYSGNTYGLFKDEVNRKLEEYTDVYFIANADGARQIVEQYPDKTTVFWLSIDPFTMEKRMLERGDSEQSTVERIEHAIRTGELERPLIDGRNVIEIDAKQDVESIVGFIIRKID